MAKSDISQKLLQIRQYMMRKAAGEKIPVYRPWAESSAAFRQDLEEKYLLALKKRRKVIFGRLNLSVGYVPENVSFDPKEIDRERKPFSTNLPFIGMKDGKQYVGVSRKEFAAEHGIRNFHNITHALNGERKQVEGWTFKYQ